MTTLQRAKNADVVLAVGVVGLLCVLLIPLPAWLLDLLLAVNLSSSILVLLLVLSNERPLDLSTFPSVLLFASLFRLSLNVASTRLILLRGNAGTVIEAFGEFVVGGSVIVGVVIFLILIVIQFVVITKGAGRISEVAARFTLDAMPGKQMAIDSELNAGIITPEEAKTRRRDVSMEAEFYGAMDGASKFVRGDAMAGMIITLVNIVGGLGVGLAGGISLGSALTKYTILTVGDGLVSQIPALIIATSGAIIVTKTSTESNLADDLATQVTRRRRGFLLAAFIIGVVGLLPGLPMPPFLIISAGLFLVARRPESQPALVESEEPTAEQLRTQQNEELHRLLHLDRLGIELGYRLLPLVEKGAGGGLLDHISQMRRRFASELGILVPPIRVTDNTKVAPTVYQVLIQGETVASGELYPDRLLAMCPGGAAEELAGEAAQEPAFGLPAVWIDEGQRVDAELKGYTVVDPGSVLATHLGEVVRENCAEIFARDDVKSLLEQLHQEQPAVVDELVPNLMSYSDVHQVLRCLLRERVSIKNLSAILEVLSENAASLKDPNALAELCRQRLARSLVARYVDDEGSLRVITLDPSLERVLAEVALNQDTPRGPGVVRHVAESIAVVLREQIERGQEAVVVVRAEVRTFLRDIIQTVVPRSVVLSYSEASRARKLEPVIVIQADEPVVGSEAP